MVDCLSQLSGISVEQIDRTVIFQEDVVVTGSNHNVTAHSRNGGPKPVAVSGNRILVRLQEAGNRGHGRRPRTSQHGHPKLTVSRLTLPSCGPIRRPQDLSHTLGLVTTLSVVKLPSSSRTNTRKPRHGRTRQGRKIHPARPPQKPTARPLADRENPGVVATIKTASPLLGGRSGDGGRCAGMLVSTTSAVPSGLPIMVSNTSQRSTAS